METDPALARTAFLDHDAPDVGDFVQRALRDTGTGDRERAVALYYAVRDGIRYEIYGADLSRNGLTASQVVRSGKGLCIHKSVLYVAALRSVGIPARLVFADVRNHLSSEAVRARVGGDVFRYHAFTSLRLDRWLRATPVFNRLLCRLYRIEPMEFDGTADSVYHPYDESGEHHMELLWEHGEFDDLPYEEVLAGLRAGHPRLFPAGGGDRFVAGSLEADAAGTAALPAH
ncbi:transglutaminase-like domain-containing protein [Streptomyces coffeae]|uniref:Transglutaminase domain-containing protein n=1 Tax=Streptomyces coffeae TaxID=621382 RepID=A0ABS1NH50_9ACTN|nr:transglutaminase-like domain-containing protein [Streptomyces coffeae]MBL1099262.1 transglutaminase domain-containing protein [Streptomyces coffeae]